ncbi:hypothetical protein HID58_002870, partial [Brassica napus]
YMTKPALMWVFNSSIEIGEAVSLTDSNELMEVAGYEAMRKWLLRVFGFGLRTVLCVSCLLSSFILRELPSYSDGNPFSRSFLIKKLILEWR